jgi:integrase
MQKAIDKSSSFSPNAPPFQGLGVYEVSQRVGKIYPDRGNRWYIRLLNGEKICCDKQHRTFYDKKQAEAGLVQIASDMLAGTFDSNFYKKTKKSLLSFSVYAEQWLQRYERRMGRGELSPTYLKEVRRWVKKRFIPHFGEISILDIKGLHIRNFVDSIEGVSLKTRQNIADCLQKLFRDAIDDEIIQRCPKFPKRDVGLEPTVKWATEEVQDAIFEQLDEDDLFFIFSQACHGTRTGETRALQFRDIDLSNDTVTIRRSFAGNKLRETTKSKRIRVIPLDPSWKQLLLQRPTPFNPEIFVFTKQGKPYSESWMRKQWNKACESAGVPHITLYQGSRHSLASQAASRGVSIYLISKMLGHSNVKMTEKYADVLTQPLRAVHRNHPRILPFRKPSANEKTGA